MACCFPRVAGCISNAVVDTLSGGALVVRARGSSRAFRIFHRGGPRGVFIGELEETIAQIRVDGTTGEAAATLGLLAKV